MSAGEDTDGDTTQDPGDSGPDGGRPDGDGSGPGTGGDDDPDGGDPPGGGPGSGRDGPAEPAELPGWGYVPAWLARHLVARMHSAQWRYAVCDSHGQVVDGGLITTRPATPGGVRVRRDARRGGIVEIALRPDELTRLAGPEASSSAAGAITTWAPVLAELAKLVAPPARAIGSTRDAARRTPGAQLRRWIQQRDRRCVHPCCRVPAAKADQDHRIGYAAGGPTIEANLSTPCRHDHRLKDQGHWALTTPRPGLTIWTSPLGRRYESRPPPAIPRPVTAPTYQPRGQPVGDFTGPPDTCACMLTPCRHDQQAAAATDTKAEDNTGNKHPTADTGILDDGTPPF